MAEVLLERGARLSLFAVPRAAGGHQVVEEGDGVVLGVVTEGSVAGNLAEPTKGHTVAGPRGVSNDVALPVEEGALMRREGLARSEERRVGKECVRTRRYRWAP